MIKKWILGNLFQNPVPTFSMMNGWYKSLGYSQVNVSGAAVGVGVVPSDTIMTLITIDGGDIRFRDDGVNPTASVGMKVDKGGVIKYDADPSTLKFINVSAAASVNVTFYGIGGTDA